MYVHVLGLTKLNSIQELRICSSYDSFWRIYSGYKEYLNVIVFLIAFT